MSVILVNNQYCITTIELLISVVSYNDEYIWNLVLQVKSLSSCDETEHQTNAVYRSFLVLVT